MFRFTDEDGTIVEFSRPAQAEVLAKAIARALGKDGFVILAISDGMPQEDPQYRSGWWGPLDRLRQVVKRLEEDIEPLFTLTDASDGLVLAGPRPELAAFSLARKICELSGRSIVVTNIRTQLAMTISPQS